MLPSGLMIVIFCGAMLTAAISDLLSMTIRNRVSLCLAGAFIILAPFTGMGWASYFMHFMAGFMVLGITFGLFILRAMGGGDAKLLSATALWFGFTPVLASYVLHASIMGGLLTLLIIAYRAMPLPAVAGRLPFMRMLASKNVGIPYGIALGIAGIWTFPQSPLGNWAMSQIF